MGLLSPIKKLFLWLYIILYTPLLLLGVAFDTTFYIIPWARPSSKWSINQAVRMRVVKFLLLHWSLTKAGERLHLGQGREKNRFEVAAPRSPKLYRGPLLDRFIQPAQVGMTWTPARPPPPSLIRPDLIVALHFHGGAYVIGNGRDEDTGLLAQSLFRHAGFTHVCTPQYRLSSSKGGHFPAPLQDALTAYLFLIKTKGISAEQIVLSGDSAGANLALALLRYINEHGKQDELPLPKAVMLWSPWVDVSAAIEQDMSLSPNYKTDYLNKQFGRWGADTISDRGRISPASPYLSPLRHPFELERSLPTFVHAGGAEVLCDDIKDFCEKYRKVGWNAHLHVSDYCPHDLLLLGERIGFGVEANLAAEEARKFLSQAGVKLRSYH
jgi:acetyl esterase/lipase